MTIVKGFSWSILVLVIVSALCISFNFSSFMEGYYNGYVTMQTIPESIAAFIGNISFDLIKWV